MDSTGTVCGTVCERDMTERIPRELRPEQIRRMVDPRGTVINGVDDVFHAMLCYSGNIREWFGVPMLKNDFDCRRYLEILDAFRPEIIVETGVARGGSALFFMYAIQLMEFSCLYLGVELDHRVMSPKVIEIADSNSWHYAFIYRDCLAAETLETVAAHVKGKRQLIILDSVHTEEHVTEELRLYAPLVTDGSYLVIEDTDHSGHPLFPNYGPSGGEGVAKFMSPGGLGAKLGFGRDLALEGMFKITNSPGGWLKRLHAAADGVVPNAD